MIEQQDLEWYRMPAETVLETLSSSRQGLDEQEAKKRLEQYGPNQLEFKRPSAWMRFLRQFHNPLVYVLLAAATITTLLSISGEEMFADTVIILSVVLINAILGFFQEGKAENALAALQDMIVPECTVIREGHQQMIPTRELVPGDVVVLNGGDKVPADLRLFECSDAAADEAMLTGESVPVDKTVEPVDRPNLTPGDQTCMAFSGTFLARGHALGVVASSAKYTQFGRIASMVTHTESAATPLQRKISDFTHTLIIAILSVGIVNFGLGALFGYTLAYSFLASVSLIVAAIPEMLPMIVTAILALAATTMAKRNALIRHLPAAETLGCTTVICSDKTGTLTRNEMTVRQIHAGGKSYEVSGAGYAVEGRILALDTMLEVDEPDLPLLETLRAGTLCNDAEIIDRTGQAGIVGDPTEAALKVSAAKAGIEDMESRLDEIPFSSELMLMATLHEGEDGNVIYLKGSPERVVMLCSEHLVVDASHPLDQDAVKQEVERMAKEALRVIGMAYKRVDMSKTELTLGDLENLTFLGLQGMIDPPRPEAVEAVSRCSGAGIRTIMITGDHVLTAKAIAHQIGITESADAPACDGTSLQELSDEDLREMVAEVSVFARVAPEHKLRIATSLQHHGHIVAMTGDGVNDAPALKAANIGVSMGKSGTEVSKEASSMILTDDNFATIINAVEEGRHVWSNLEKAILYTLPTNGGQAMLVMGAVLLAPFIPLFAVRLPLEPVQILWVNLFDSVFLTMPLMMEPKIRNLLNAPPRDPSIKIANAMFLQRVVLMGLSIAVPGFLIFHYFGAPAVQDGVVVDPLLLSQAQTAAFWAVLFTHLGFVASARAIYASVFTLNPFSNKWLLVGITLSLVFHAGVTFIPFLSEMFRCAVFPTEWWPIILLCLLPSLVMLELDKFLRARFGAAGAVA